MSYNVSIREILFHRISYILLTYLVFDQYQYTINYQKYKCIPYGTHDNQNNFIIGFITLDIILLGIIRLVSNSEVLSLFYCIRRFNIIDVVVEIDSELREDALFNILHENEREIGGFTIDINPIRKEETGTLETYLPNVEKYLSEKSASIGAPDYEQAIRDGFSALYANHKYSDKQRLFLDRIQKFAIKNNIAENIIDTAMAKNPAFHNTYGNREYVSRNIFGRRLGSTEKELEAAIKQAFERTPEKEPETLEDVVAKFFSSDSSEVKSVNGVWSMNLTDGEPYAEV